MYKLLKSTNFYLVVINVMILSSCNYTSKHNEAQADTTGVINVTEETKESNSSDASVNYATEKENKPETDCNNNKRAYEFGREMATMVKLGSSSLASAIREYAESLSIEEPFKSSDPCVKKGFDDENNGVPSPYNKDGQNWTSF